MSLQDSAHVSGGQHRASSALASLHALGVRHAVMQAGMSTASGPKLAGAVSAAGGIGTLGLHDVSVWESVIEQTKAEAQGRPMCANLLLPYTRRRHVEILIRQRVPMVTLFWGHAPQLIRQLQSHDVFVFQQIGSEEEARKALDAGIDGLIVQGLEAGGHVRAQARLEALLPRISKLSAELPVFAAGGVYSAKDAAHTVALGADGVCSGTRFLLTPESHIHEAYRQRLLDADSTMLTHLFGLGWPDLHRVVPNAATDRWCDEGGAIPTWLHRLNAAFSFTRKIVPMKAGIAKAQQPGRPFFSPALMDSHMPAELVEATALYAGEHIARIRRLESAANVVRELARGLEAGNNQVAVSD